MGRVRHVQFLEVTDALFAVTKELTYVPRDCLDTRHLKDLHHGVKLSLGALALTAVPSILSQTQFIHPFWVDQGLHLSIAKGFLTLYCLCF